MSDVKDWKDLSDDDILNYQGPGDYLGVMNRYDRITAHKTLVALNNASAAQTKLQWVTIALTVVIALATVAYTWITWELVKVQREANQIQRDAVAKPK